MGPVEIKTLVVGHCTKRDDGTYYYVDAGGQDESVDVDWNCAYATSTAAGVPCSACQGKQTIPLEQCVLSDVLNLDGIQGHTSFNRQLPEGCMISLPSSSNSSPMSQTASDVVWAGVGIAMFVAVLWYGHRHKKFSVWCGQTMAAKHGTDASLACTDGTTATVSDILPPVDAKFLFQFHTALRTSSHSTQLITDDNVRHLNDLIKRVLVKEEGCTKKDNMVLELVGKQGWTGDAFERRANSPPVTYKALMDQVEAKIKKLPMTVQILTKNTFVDKDRKRILKVIVALFSMLLVVMLTGYLSSFAASIATALHLDNTFVDTTGLEHIFSVRSDTIIATMIISIVVGFLVVFFGANLVFKIIGPARTTTTNAEYERTHQRHTWCVLMIIVVVIVFELLGFTILPNFENAVQLVSNSNTTSGGQGAILNQAAMAQTNLVKHVILDRQNTLFVYIALATALGFHFALQKTFGAVSSSSGTTPPVSFASMRTVSISISLTCVLGASTSAFTIMQSLPELKYWFISLYLVNAVFVVCMVCYNGRLPPRPKEAPVTPNWDAHVLTTTFLCGTPVVLQLIQLFGNPAANTLYFLALLAIYTCSLYSIRVVAEYYLRIMFNAKGDVTRNTTGACAVVAVWAILCLGITIDQYTAAKVFGWLGWLLAIGVVICAAGWIYYTYRNIYRVDTPEMTELLAIVPWDCEDCEHNFETSIVTHFGWEISAEKVETEPWKTATSRMWQAAPFTLLLMLQLLVQTVVVCVSVLYYVVVNVIKLPRVSYHVLLGSADVAPEAARLGRFERPLVGTLAFLVCAPCAMAHTLGWAVYMIVATCISSTKDGFVRLVKLWSVAGEWVERKQRDFVKELRVKNSRAYVGIAFCMYMYGFPSAMNVWEPNYGSTEIQQMLQKRGLVLDSNWGGLNQTATEWQDMQQRVFVIEVLVAGLMLAVVIFETFGLIVWSDVVCLFLFALNVTAKLLPAFIDFSQSLHITDIMEQMRCAPDLDILFQSLVQSTFGQVSQLLVAGQLGPLVVATAFSVFRAGNLTCKTLCKEEAECKADCCTPRDLATVCVVIETHRGIRNGAVTLYRIAPALSIFITLPQGLLVAQYVDNAIVKVLILSFWLLPFASALLYTGNDSDTKINYAVTVWVLSLGLLVTLGLYLASLYYGNMFYILQNLLQSAEFWRYLIRDVSGVLINLRVLGQFVFSGLHGLHPPNNGPAGTPLLRTINA